MTLTTYKLEKLIDLVSEYPCLYNPKDMRYKDNAIKDAVWETISEKIRGTSAALCKKRWKYIMGSYLKTMQRRGVTGRKNQGANSRFYKKMTFLDGIEGLERRPNRFPLPSTSHDMSVPIKYVENAAGAIGSQKILPIKTLKRVHLRDVIGSPLLLKPKIDKDPTKTSSSKSSDDNSNGFYEIPLISNDNRIDEIKQLPNQDPSNFFFAKYALEVLRKLPPSLQIQAKEDLYGVLNKFCELKRVPPAHVPSEAAAEIDINIKCEVPDSEEVRVKVEPNEEDYLENIY